MTTRANSTEDGIRIGVDIGTGTRRAFSAAIAGSRTVVWNGPMGVFEIDAFSTGTITVAHAVADCAGTTVIGGGDSVAAAAPFRGDDVVLLTCKAQHTAAALGELRAAGAPPMLPIVCCQNAIWNESHAQRVFPNVYGAVVFVPGFYLDPGEVINARVGHYGYPEVGRYPTGTDALCARVVEDLAAAGFAAAVNPSVMRAKGAKCLGNLANAVAAIIGGLGNMQGAVYGGLLLGVSEVLLRSWLPEDLVGITDGVVFALIALFFIFRPQGLVYVRSAERV